MNNSITIRLKKHIFSMPMAISILISTYMLVHPIRDTIYLFFSQGITQNNLNLLQNAIYQYGHTLFIPIFACLPAATIFADDVNSGYIKFILPRSSANKYFFETFLCSSICGGISTFIPYSIAVLVSFTVGKPYVLEEIQEKIEYYGNYGIAYDNTIFEGMQYILGGLLIGISIAIVSFICGAIWSNFGLLISGITTNKYIVISAPFIIYYAAFLLFYRIGDLVYFSPVNMISGDLMRSYSFWICYNIIFYVLVLAITYPLIKRRLLNV